MKIHFHLQVLNVYSFHKKHFTFHLSPRKEIELLSQTMNYTYGGAFFLKGFSVIKYCNRVVMQDAM